MRNPPYHPFYNLQLGVTMQTTPVLYLMGKYYNIPQNPEIYPKTRKYTQKTRKCTKKPKKCNKKNGNIPKNSEIYPKLGKSTIRKNPPYHPCQNLQLGGTTQTTPIPKTQNYTPKHGNIPQKHGNIPKNLQSGKKTLSPLLESTIRRNHPDHTCSLPNGKIL